MNMNYVTIRDLVEKLQSLHKRYHVGLKNEAAIDTMEPVLRELERECLSSGCLGQKLASARHNFETMYSARKHLKYGGAEEVSCRFGSDLFDIIKFLDGKTRKNQSGTEGNP